MQITAQLISDCVFATGIVHSLFFQNQEFEACSHIAWFVSNLVEHPKDRFCLDVAQIFMENYRLLFILKHSPYVVSKVGLVTCLIYRYTSGEDNINQNLLL